MNRPFRLPLPRACALLLLALAAVCCGQNTPESRDISKPLSAKDPLPALPVNGLLDEGNVFSVEEAAQMAGDIENFRAAVSFPLYVVTANYIHGDTLEHYAGRLVEEGLKGRTGMVLMYERGSGLIQYSAPPGALGPAEDTVRLFQASRDAAIQLPAEATKAQRLRTAVQTLTLDVLEFRKTGKLPEVAAIPPPAAPASHGDLPAPPQDFVLDEADAFDAAAEEALKAELAKFHAEHDMDVYVLTRVFLPDQTAQGQAQQLAQKWLPERCGAVLVINRGTGPGESPLGLALARNDEQIIPGGQLQQMLERARLKGEEERNRPDGSVAASARAAVREILETLAKHGDAGRAAQAQVTTPRQWNVMTGMVGALLVGALLLFAFHRIQERLERRSNEQFRFPDVTVGRRLGAMQGGGSVAGISFPRRRE